MKTGTLFLLFLNLIGNIFSEVIDYNYNEEIHSLYSLENSYEYYDERKGFPEVEVVNGPNHYNNNDTNIDVFGTADNYMKKYLPNVEYRMIQYNDYSFSDHVYIDYVQQYKGVDVYDTQIKLEVSASTGNIHYVIDIVFTDFKADDFVKRSEDEAEEAAIILEYLNKDLFNGELDLFNDITKEHKFIKIPISNFGFTTVKKNLSSNQ